jgi:glutathione S-transferase
MKLYGDIISPFVRMAMVAGLEAGLGDRLKLVEMPVKPTEANGALVAKAPLGKIPVLETDHHHQIYDSRVIIEYLAHVSGNKTLIPDEGVARFRILTLQALAQGLGDSAVALRYELAARPSGSQWPEWIARTTERMKAALDDLDKNWGDTLSTCNAGSIATAVVLDYVNFRHPDLDWPKGRAKLAAFHATFSQRPSMVQTTLAKK